MRLFGHKMMHHAVGKHTANGGLFDVQFGLALLRDRRVPVVSKLMALSAGAGIIALMISLELPLESLIGLILPLLGAVADVAVDGIEAVLGPVVIAALLLPHLAPSPIVHTILNERLQQSPPASISG